MLRKINVVLTLMTENNKQFHKFGERRCVSTTWSQRGLKNQDHVELAHRRSPKTTPLQLAFNVRSSPLVPSMALVIFFLEIPHLLSYHLATEFPMMHPAATDVAAFRVRGETSARLEPGSRECGADAPREA